MGHGIAQVAAAGYAVCAWSLAAGAPRAAWTAPGNLDGAAPAEGDTGRGDAALARIAVRIRGRGGRRDS
jgi:hypothetical protein